MLGGRGCGVEMYSINYFTLSLLMCRRVGASLCQANIVKGTDKGKSLRISSVITMHTVDHTINLQSVVMHDA